MLKLLIVEDERMIADFICCGLAEANFEYDCAYDGLSAADMIDQNRYDLILLDVMLPGVDGFELMRYIAPLGIPVIFLTAKAGVDDRVAGLRLGADDYIVKPFEMIELLARIDTVLKRYGKGSVELSLGDVSVNTRTRVVTRNGAAIALRAREYDLAVFLLRNRDLPLFRETIYERVWGGEFTGDTRTVDIHIRRLRQKLGWEDRLVTINRVGYKLNSKI